MSDPKHTTMGAKNSRKKLPAEDLEFLMVNTRYDEATISEWYKGFRQDCPEGKLSTDLFMKIYSKRICLQNVN